MTSDHLALDLLERALRDEADAAEWRVIVRHLLGACPECRARAAAVAQRIGGPEAEPSGAGDDLGVEPAAGGAPIPEGEGKR